MTLKGALENELFRHVDGGLGVAESIEDVGSLMDKLCRFCTVRNISLKLS